MMPFSWLTGVVLWKAAERLVFCALKPQGVWVRVVALYGVQIGVAEGEVVAFKYSVWCTMGSYEGCSSHRKLIGNGRCFSVNGLR